VPVSVTRPLAREVTDYEDFAGRAQAVSTVELHAHVTGYLVKAPFKDGDRVKQGDLLFEIDPRPYQAELDRAEAEVARCEARLRRAAAAPEGAGKAPAPGEADRLRADRAEAEAALRVAQADREIRKLNLAFTRVASPIDGRAGRRLVDPGNLVKADETALTTVVSLDPMYAYFDVDERTLLRLVRLAREGKGGPVREAKTPVFLGLDGEAGYPRRGVLDFLDNHLDPDTGTVRARAVLPNADGALVPGLFVRARLPVGAPRRALLVPEAAVGTDQGEHFVYVVDGQNKAVHRRVGLGARHDDLRVVENGLRPEDSVVVGGMRRLRPGVTVEPRQVELPAPPREGPR
jgi:RND family efflux transporter MFP subunit